MVGEPFTGENEKSGNGRSHLPLFLCTKPGLLIIFTGFTPVGDHQMTMKYHRYVGEAERADKHMENLLCECDITSMKRTWGIYREITYKCGEKATKRIYEKGKPHNNIVLCDECARKFFVDNPKGFWESDNLY